MKTYNKKDVKAFAIRLMTSKRAILFGKIQKLDKRYSFNKEVLKYIAANKLTASEQSEILAKMKSRAKNKPAPYTNVLSRPLVKDFKSHKCDLRQILPDRLVFISGRNHWAKDSFDKKILSILKK